MISSRVNVERRIGDTEVGKDSSESCGNWMEEGSETGEGGVEGAETREGGVGSSGTSGLENGKCEKMIQT